MRHFFRMPENRELLAITYKNDMIFEMKSATLKPSACVEIGHIANMINFFPGTAVHVEVGSDANSLESNGQLRLRRVQAVKAALLREGIDASRIRTTMNRATSTLSSEDTVSVKVVDRLMRPFKPAPNSFQNGSQYRILAAR